MKRIAMALVRFYRKNLSGLKPAPTCRFRPTCSAYALEAFEKRGFFVGLALSVWRILRCSPLSPAGYDPVPDAGFKTMPMRWSKYDKYKAEREANVSRDPSMPDPSSLPSEESSSDGDA